jgi:hypothetical protein
VLLHKHNHKIQSKGKLLTTGQVELLHWYCHLGHCAFKQILKLADQGHIQLSAAAKMAKLPKCLSCIIGKAHRQAWKSNKSGKAICSHLNVALATKCTLINLSAANPT